MQLGDDPVAMLVPVTLAATFLVARTWRMLGDL